MIALWLIPLIIAIILLLPVSLRIRYENGAAITVSHIITFKLYPKKQKRKKEKSNKNKKQNKADKDSSKKKKKRLSAEDIIALAGIVLNTIKKLLKSVYFSRFVLNLTVSGSDAAKAAVNYGNVCALVTTFFPIIEGKNKKIKKTDISVDLDFDGKTSFTADVILRAILIRILIILIASLICVVKYISKNKKKGGRKK